MSVKSLNTNAHRLRQIPSLPLHGGRLVLIPEIKCNIRSGLNEVQFVYMSSRGQTSCTGLSQTSSNGFCLQSLWSTTFLPPCRADSLKNISCHVLRNTGTKSRPSLGICRWFRRGAKPYLGASTLLKLPFQQFCGGRIKKCGYRPLMTFRGLFGLQSEGTHDTQQRGQSGRHQALTHILG